MNLQNSTFASRLIEWYLQHMRDLPWRKSQTPYKVWLSEIIMQQTRVAQGIPYYLEFLEKYPDVFHLANASEDDVLKSWQGLGYYTRARNLHHTAKYIATTCDGKFPNTYKELVKLKGIGDYTASAIASICFNQPEAVVDGNVFRVLSRMFGIETPINSGKGQKEFKDLAQKLIDRSQPGTFNQALMEFGALQCTPKSPKCGECVFNTDCVAFQTGKIGDLPVKNKAKPVRKRYFNYLVPLTNKGISMLVQRKANDIWQQLYEFPLVETNRKVTAKTLRNTDGFQEWSATWPIEDLELFNTQPVVHKLSHQHIYASFWIVSVGALSKDSDHYSKLFDYAVPVLIANFMTDFFEKQCDAQKIA